MGAIHSGLRPARGKTLLALFSETQAIKAQRQPDSKSQKLRISCQAIAYQITVALADWPATPERFLKPTDCRRSPGWPQT
jgi:hypothetical protein